MALFNIFKNKKKVVKKAAPKESKPRPEKSGREVANVPLKSKKNSAIAYRILQHPHVTEKAADLTHSNQYVFNVSERSNKSEIKKAVQDVYGVKVVSVKIINIHPKPKMLGKIKGWRKAYKKTIVRLAQGQTIEILPR
ncbi:MAG: 50S ribosomal protein L23 [Candidatus Nealsonbacteria bacterium]